MNEKSLLHPDQRTPNARAFAASAWALCVVLIGANLSTPLYPIWQTRWAFSTGTLTVIFAAYVLGIIVALMLVGRLSDLLGRRFILLPALVIALLATALFWSARGVDWLIAARAAQGFAVGATTGTATAGLADYESCERQGRAPLVGAAASVVGLSLGPLIAGLIAEFIAKPDAAVWFLDAVLIGSSLLFAARALPRIDRAESFRFRFQKVGVPREIRTVFLGCAGVFLCGWVATALFLALGPTFVLSLLHLQDHAIAGAAVFSVFAASAIAQLATRLFIGADAKSEHAEMLGGLAAMLFGLVLFILGLGCGSLALFVIGGLLTGFAQGVSYRGSLAELQAQTPAPRRGEVMGAYYLVGYVGVAVLIPAVGFSAPRIGLVAACALFCAVLILVGAGSSALLIGSRRRRRTYAG